MRCKGGKKDGGRCGNNAKENGYCHLHQDQADKGEPSAVTRRSSANSRRGSRQNDRSSDSSDCCSECSRGAACAASSNHGSRKDHDDMCQAVLSAGQNAGTRCPHPARANGYCGKHQKQAAQQRVVSGRSSVSCSRADSRNINVSRRSSDNEGCQCQGTLQSGRSQGQRCPNQAQDNGYCGTHQRQATSTSSRAQSSSNKSSGRSGHNQHGNNNADSDDDSDDDSGADSDECNSYEINNRKPKTGTSTSQRGASIHALSGRLRQGNPGEDLQETEYRPFHSIEVAGCNGSASDRKGGWLGRWNKFFGFNSDTPQTCIAARCRLEACCGGHLWVKGKEDVYHCYIGPVCPEHNACRYDYPKYFRTTEDVRLMKIVSHEAFVEWENGRYMKREARRCLST